MPAGPGTGLGSSTLSRRTSFGNAAEFGVAGAGAGGTGTGEGEKESDIALMVELSSPPSVWNAVAGSAALGSGAVSMSVPGSGSGPGGGHAVGIGGGRRAVRNTPSITFHGQVKSVATIVHSWKAK